MGYIFRVIFVFNILHEREARVQYENKNNEKNIFHIARRFHAILSLNKMQVNLHSRIQMRHCGVASEGMQPRSTAVLHGNPRVQVFFALQHRGAANEIKMSLTFGISAVFLDQYLNFH